MARAILWLDAMQFRLRQCVGWVRKAGNPPVARADPLEGDSFGSVDSSLRMAAALRTRALQRVGSLRRPKA
eukprot:3319621-Alexandrium_andersonii.AAC.1